ncbi:hypothetical protein K449DRAFT_257852 [Hypoxylon sp. EC38]|nr:hypothetical protein K449DRAFT_257852 [Hypoxylon sp. EC38]
MASTTFHLFPHFSKEIQMRIWREFILDANKERLVMVDENRREIIPTRFLAYSPFCVNLLSRDVFMELYPVQMPVFRTYRMATFEDDDSDDASLDYDYTVEDEDSNSDATSRILFSEFSNYRGESCGIIYLNFSQDIFIVDGISRFNYDFDEGRFRPPCYDITAKNKTLPFTRKQLGRMENLMEVTIYQIWRAKKPIPPIRHLVKLNKHNYSKKVFEGVKNCYHLYSFFDRGGGDYFGEDFDIQEDLLTLPGHEILDKWVKETVRFDEKMLTQKPKEPASNE